MGRTDDLTDLKEALNLLVEVAEGKKGQLEVRRWLEKNHPTLCEEEPKKKW